MTPRLGGKPGWAPPRLRSKPAKPLHALVVGRAEPLHITATQHPFPQAAVAGGMGRALWKQVGRWQGLSRSQEVLHGIAREREPCVGRILKVERESQFPETRSSNDDVSGDEAEPRTLTLASAFCPEAYRLFTRVRGRSTYAVFRESGSASGGQPKWTVTWQYQEMPQSWADVEGLKPAPLSRGEIRKAVVPKLLHRPWEDPLTVRGRVSEIDVSPITYRKGLVPLTNGTNAQLNLEPSSSSASLPIAQTLKAPARVQSAAEAAQQTSLSQRRVRQLGARPVPVLSHLPQLDLSCASHGLSKERVMRIPEPRKIPKRACSFQPRPCPRPRPEPAPPGGEQRSRASPTPALFPACVRLPPRPAVEDVCSSVRKRRLAHGALSLTIGVAAVLRAQLHPSSPLRSSKGLKGRSR
ncbi:hypothetical protein TREES_T100014080 [Tupaia chinensis]|uniref:Uncharacterized protein n=1 Tax=Tupaia chinensis TaxID=246437 RepID=L9KLC1_TUPCH|nr:hypothetical protein TREES_T100014080 [Tupaia chinensis]